MNAVCTQSWLLFFKIQRKCTQVPNNAHQEWLRMS